jgi:hypothetical protein
LSENELLSEPVFVFQAISMADDFGEMVFFAEEGKELRPQGVKPSSKSFHRILGPYGRSKVSGNKSVFF